MNTNTLAKQYDKLTPRERLPLILAASVRGDEAERDRLARSAPRVGLRVQDYFGLSQAFVEVSHLHFMESLDFAGHYLEALAVASAEKPRKHKKEDDIFGPDWELAMLLGYRFHSHRAGWKLFCSELRLDPDAFCEILPGFSTIQRAEQLSGERPDGRPGIAYVAEGVARYLARRAGADPAADKVGDMATEALKPFWPVTAENIAASLHASLNLREEWWGK